MRKKRKNRKKTETVISQNLNPGLFGPLVLRRPQMGEGGPTQSTNALSAVSDLTTKKIYVLLCSSFQLQPHRSTQNFKTLAYHHFYENLRTVFSILKKMFVLLQSQCPFSILLIYNLLYQRTEPLDEPKCIWGVLQHPCVPVIEADSTENCHLNVKKRTKT